MTEQSTKKRPNSVLFLCGQNMIRSPMGEALTKHLFPNQIFADSAGVNSGGDDPFVDIVLNEIGITERNHEPKSLDYLEDNYFDLIIALTNEAHEAALELADNLSTSVEYWETPNPSTIMGSRDQILDAYRQVRDSIKARIIERFNP
jgi:protein-tyrosine-phosphatase